MEPKSRTNRSQWSNYGTEPKPTRSLASWSAEVLFSFLVRTPLLLRRTTNFWPRSTARRCLAGLARRWYALAVSSEVFTENEAIAVEFQPRFPTCNSAGALAWLRQKAM